MRNTIILVLILLLVFTSELKPCKSIRQEIAYTIKLDNCLNDYKGRSDLRNQCVADLKRQYKK